MSDTDTTPKRKPLGLKRSVDAGEVNADPGAPPRRLGQGIGQHFAVRRDRQANEIVAPGGPPGKHAAPPGPVTGVRSFRDVESR